MNQVMDRAKSLAQCSAVSMDIAGGRGKSGACASAASNADALATVIQKRIEKQLPGRVQNLTVECQGMIVKLKGECATFYSKQMAQQAAMGALEDERLVNEICVGAA